MIPPRIVNFVIEPIDGLQKIIPSDPGTLASSGVELETHRLQNQILARAVPQPNGEWASSNRARFSEQGINGFLC